MNSNEILGSKPEQYNKIGVRVRGGRKVQNRVAFLDLYQSREGDLNPHPTDPETLVAEIRNLAGVVQHDTHGRGFRRTKKHS